jgi:hypothetical protein
MALNVGRFRVSMPARWERPVFLRNESLGRFADLKQSAPTDRKIIRVQIASLDKLYSATRQMPPNCSFLKSIA